MSVKKKVALFNIILVVVPLFSILLAAIVFMRVYGVDFWENVEEIYQDEEGMYIAQNTLIMYGEAIEDASKAKHLDQNGNPYNVEMNQNRKKLNSIGYHILVYKNNKVILNGLNDKEALKMEEMLGGTIAKADEITMRDNGVVIIKNVIQIENDYYEFVAVHVPQDIENASYRHFLYQNIVVFMIVVFCIFLLLVVTTNLVISMNLSRMILEPLGILSSGTKKITEGELDFKLEYQKSDEFGEVCRNFDNMRETLKTSIETQLRYEEAKKQLLSGISHDLRTPLTSIKGYAEGLIDGIADTQETRIRYYKAILTRSKDMEHLVNDLNVYTKTETTQKFHMEQIEIGKFVEKLLDEYWADAKRESVTFCLNVQEEPLWIFADTQELKRVFMNIIRNSIKYRIRMTSEITITTDRKVIPGRNKNEFAMIRIADDGPGVLEEDLEKIFVSFYRGDLSRTKPGEGSGLGLAIARQIIETHGGFIEAKNEEGLAIYIYLPLVGGKV